MIKCGLAATTILTFLGVCQSYDWVCLHCIENDFQASDNSEAVSEEGRYKTSFMAHNRLLGTVLSEDTWAASTSGSSNLRPGRKTNSSYAVRILEKHSTGFNF